MTIVDTNTIVLVHPKRSLLVTAVITFFVLTVPLFSVLYWYGAGDHLRPEFLAAHIGLVLLGVAVFWRQTRVFTAVTQTSLKGNGIFSPLVEVERDTITTVMLVQVYNRDLTDTTTQFVALDEDGRCLFRLRGHFWHRGDLDAVATATGCGVVVDSTPHSYSEFFERFPGSRYWFEFTR